MRRREAREVAIKVLYQIDMTKADVTEAFRKASIDGEPAKLSRFCHDLVVGTVQNRQEIDAVLERLCAGWPLSRMPVVDRNILRLAAFEILYGQEAAPAVVINEAVELAKTYGTEDSPRFINGVLGKLVEQMKNAPRKEEAPQ